MSKQRFRRRKLWVDGQIQGAIIVRLLTYYLACGITATCMLVAWRVAVHGTQGGLQQHLATLWTQLGPGALSLILLLPMVVFDAVRLSHRFTGPMVRIRKTMRLAAKGGMVQAVKLRETDYWQDIANDLNALLEEFNALRPTGEETEKDDTEKNELKDLDATLQSAQETQAAANQATQSSFAHKEEELETVR